MFGQLDRPRQYWIYALLALLVNVVSAVAFNAVVGRIVFDEVVHMPEVHRYATLGVSVETILRHPIAPGPTTHILLAEVVRAVPGHELRTARVVVLAMWVALCLAVLAAVRWGHASELWYPALLATLCFPHTPTAMATVLTEGPALLFAVVGVLMWIRSTQGDMRDLVSSVSCICGGLLMGVAVTCRQYYIGLLPAMAAFVVYEAWRRRSVGGQLRWVVVATASCFVAAIPIGLLVSIWHGLSSPAMVAGAGGAFWHSAIGVDLSRPLIAGFYIALYVFPLTFPVIGLLRRKQWALAAAIAAGSAVLLAPARDTVLQWGPLRSVLEPLHRLPGAEAVAFAAIVALLALNMVALSWRLWEQRQSLSSFPLVVFSGFFLVVFVVEQIGVGGSVPFWERYVVQAIPFLAILAFAAVPSFSRSRIVVLISLLVIGQVMLWRWAIVS